VLSTVIPFLLLVLPLPGMSIRIINKFIYFQQHPEPLTHIIHTLHDLQRFLHQPEGHDQEQDQRSSFELIGLNIGPS
jgi:hypothetical protein